MFKLPLPPNVNVMVMTVYDIEGVGIDSQSFKYVDNFAATSYQAMTTIAAPVVTE